MHRKVAIPRSTPQLVAATVSLDIMTLCEVVAPYINIHAKIAEWACEGQTHGQDPETEAIHAQVAFADGKVFTEAFNVKQVCLGELRADYVLLQLDHENISDLWHYLLEVIGKEVLRPYIMVRNLAFDCQTVEWDLNHTVPSVACNLLEGTVGTTIGDQYEHMSAVAALLSVG